MNVGSSAWGYLQLAAGATLNVQQVNQPQAVAYSSTTGRAEGQMLAQALLAAQSLEGFFLAMMGAPEPVRQPLPAPARAQSAASLFGVAAAWSMPAFAPMGPGYAGLAPGAHLALSTSGAMGMEALGLGATWAMMGPPRNQLNASLAARIEEDPYGVSQSGQGARSNLANSPEVMLAIQALLKDDKSQKFEDLAKGLKEEFGIEAEVGEVKVKGKDGQEVTARAIKFGNGDYFVDGNGNGQLEAADYKFGDAVKALKEKYGLEDGDLTRITDRMKAQARQGPALEGLHNPPPLLHQPEANQAWMMLFFQAYWAAAAQ